MKKLTALWLFFFWIQSSLLAQWELPALTDETLLVVHQGFSLNYSEAHEQALWVAYPLTPKKLIRSLQRSNHFIFDPFVPTGSSFPHDYKRSGYDRGHLAPASDMKGNQRMLQESFYMSNISPQLPSFNRGIWKRLESWVQTEALYYETLYVVTGPVFSFSCPDCLFSTEDERFFKKLDTLLIEKKGAKELALESEAFLQRYPPIGKNQVTVPFGFYKALLKQKEPIKMIAFLIPQETSPTADLFDFTLSVNQLEEITGIDFFPLLEDEIEEALESMNQFERWKERIP